MNVELVNLGQVFSRGERHLDYVDLGDMVLSGRGIGIPVVLAGVVCVGE